MTSEYEPEAGDIIWTHFDPRVGREQSGRRPALVISPGAFWKASRFLIVCPITSRKQVLSTSAVLPAGLVVSGQVLTAHLRSIDTDARPMKYADAVPAWFLLDVRARLAALLGISA